MAEHTPTPWLISERAHFRIIAEWGDTVATVGSDSDLRDQWEANAAFIVKAVNGYDALVITLRETRDALKVLKDVVKASNKMNGREYIYIGIQVHSALDLADATLTLVEGSRHD